MLLLAIVGLSRMQYTYTMSTCIKFFSGYICLCCILMLSNGVQAADRRPVLGFTTLESSGIDKYDATIISQQLRMEIERLGVYRTLGFADIAARLAEQDLAPNCSDVRCAIIAGQILGADYFGTGQIDKIGKTYAISLQIVEVRSGLIVRNVSEFYKGKLKKFESAIIPIFARKVSGFEVDKKDYPK